MSKTDGFELVRDQVITELNTRAKLFRHIKTGAELLSLENDDENKVFGITFRTPVNNSTGVAHIMEHSVLCGSRKYPVKEPFVELLKGSLNTFLNAFTFPDKTCYPLASQNTQDFYNLIDVYLDAVFYPLISPYTLQQEGWHYELEDREATMAFKGVVFNEMKGVYSSPDSLLDMKSQQLLFPDNPYGFASGGNPEFIPDLTFEYFKNFHETYYHPSNSRIFFYGDDDPEKRLKIVDTFLMDFEAIQVDSEVTVQKHLKEARRFFIPYEVGTVDDNTAPDSQKSFMTINWLLPEIGDAVVTLGLGILEHILVETPASPLRMALIESGLGEDLAGRGLEPDLRQMFFSTGMKGIALEDADKVEALIFETLRKLARDGIEPGMVAASLNTIEFTLRENNTGSFPRGLSLMLRCLTTWLHGGDPISPLAFEAPLEAIKTRLDAGEPFFENLIRRHLLENQHRTSVVLKPDPELGQRREATERQRLDQARAGMQEDNLLAVIENSRQLKIRQETPDSPEALATIPSLKLSDIDKYNKVIPLEIQEVVGSDILYHDLFTNGIVYLDVGFDLRPLPQDLLPFVPLFGKALVEMGTETEDYVKLSQRIGQTTGGIKPTTYTSSIRQKEDSTTWLFLRGKATAAHGGDLLAILRDMLITVRLDDRERFQQIVLEEKSSLETQLIPMGHRAIDTRLKARFSEAGWVAEQITGISYLFFLRQLADRVENDWPGVLNSLEQMRHTLINRGRILCNVSLDKDNYDQFKPGLVSFLGSLPPAPKSLVSSRWEPLWVSGAEGLSIPAQVNYVGKGANLYQLGYALDGSVYVIMNYLRTTWLWERVRVRGGAYGGFCLFDHRSGVFTYLSYRDPNLLGTLENYDQTAQFMRQLDLNPEELAKSIIGAIRDMDAYQLPDAKGYNSMLRYLGGDTDESRQRLRDQILSTTAEDFSAFGEILEEVKRDGSVVVLGSAEAIQETNTTHPNWFKITKVL